MSGGNALSTKGLISSGGATTYRMRAFDSTLDRIVFWPSDSVDSTGVMYTGPGPLLDIVVQNITNDVVSIVEEDVAGVDFMPEMWAQENVQASQSNVPISATVSSNFDTIKMLRHGSIVGISTRLTEAILSGTLTVKVTKNGSAGTLTLNHTAASGSTGHIGTNTGGVDTYVPGDLIGVQISTTSDFTPVTTDLEVWLQMSETL